MFHNLTHILRLLEGGDQKRVGCKSDGQLSASDSSHEFPGRMNVIILRIQREAAVGRDEIPVRRAAPPDMVFMQRRPGTQIVPAEVRGQTEYPRRTFTLRGTRFKDRIINADILALRIETPERVGKPSRAIGGCDLFEDRRRVG